MQPPPPSDGRTQPPPSDARTSPPPVDAASPPPVDARVPPPAQITVIISGGGSVRTNIGAECAKGTCTYTVAEDTTVTLTAVNHGKNVFQSWQGAPCAGQGQTCQFTATASVTATVVFDHDH